MANVEITVLYKNQSFTLSDLTLFLFVVYDCSLGHSLFNT